MASAANINKKRALAYSEAEVMCILQIWADEKIQQKFKANMRHNVIWDHIRTELSKFGYERTAAEIKIKIQNLKSEYKKLKPSSGSATPSWPFYSIIHKVVGQRDICNRSLVHDSLEESDKENDLESIEYISQSQSHCEVVITEAELYEPPTKKCKKTTQFDPQPSTSAQVELSEQFPVQLPELLPKHLPEQLSKQTSRLPQQQLQEKSQTPPPQPQQQGQTPPPQQGQTPAPQQNLPQPPPLQRQQPQEQIQASPQQHTLRMHRPPRRQGTEENRLINQLINSQNLYMERLAMEDEKERRAEERERRAEEREIRAEKRAINAAEREARQSEAMITFFNTYTQYLISQMQNPQHLSPLSVLPPDLIPSRLATPTGIHSQQVFPPRSPSPSPNVSSVVLQPIQTSNPPQFSTRPRSPSSSPQQQSSLILKSENSDNEN